MIEVTRFDDKKLMVNAALIEFVQDTPDTVITMTTGRKILVKEKATEIRSLVVDYFRQIHSHHLDRSE